MEIKGKIYCFFEQSGTFKNEFRKLGYEADDYDIQNEYGQTDHICDIFAEIERGYDGKPSIFDEITPDDLVLAFFPCIYFTGFTNPRYYTLDNNNYVNLTMREKFDTILRRADNRNDFYKLLYKMIGICMGGGQRIILENPYSQLHYLHNNFICEPTFIDKDRTRRGDFYNKPTAYWFFNCKPTYGYSFQRPCKRKTIGSSKSAKKQGLCSQERSEISPDYARNFICDFIIGKVQPNTLPTLF